MRNKVVILALAGWALTMSPLMASAANCDSTQYPSMKKKIAELNLTADQQAKLKTVHEDRMATAKPLFEQMKTIRDKLKTELLKTEPSKQVLDGYASQLGDLHRQLVQNMNEHLLRVKAILTTEQFSKMVNFDWMHSGPGTHRGRGDHGSDRESE
jgi:Spy/CpxP family protein refolding chaperone